MLTAVMLLFYFCRESKKKLAVSYTIYCICYGLITVFDLPQHLYTAINWRLPASIRTFGSQLITLPLSLLGFETVSSSGDFLHSLLEINFQWMMIFALPFLLSYNGKRGKGFKKLFYIYYPAHVYLYYLISVFLFK